MTSASSSASNSAVISSSLPFFLALGSPPAATILAISSSCCFASRTNSNFFFPCTSFRRVKSEQQINVEHQKAEIMCSLVTLEPKQKQIKSITIPMSTPMYRFKYNKTYLHAPTHPIHGQCNPKCLQFWEW